MSAAPRPPFLPLPAALFAAAALCSPSARAQESPPPPAPPTTPAPSAVAAADWSDARLQITLTPPAGWTQMPPKPNEAAVFRGPVGPDGTAPTLGIAKENRRNDTPLDELADGLVRIFSQAAPGLRVTGRAKSRSQDTEVLRLDVALRSPQTGKAAMMRHVIARRDGRNFMFVFADGPDTFAANAALFERTLQSIRWSAPIPAEELFIRDLGITLTVPEGWRRVKDTDPDYQPGVTIFSGPKADGFTSNVVVTVRRPMGTATPLAEYVRFYFEARRDQGSRRLALTPVRLDGVDAVVEDEAQTLDEGVKVRRRMVTVLRDGRALVFNLTSSERGFTSETQAAFARMMQSLRWRRPEPGDGRPAAAR